MATVGTVLLLLCQPCGVSDALIGAIYKNVDPPIDHEMPVTVTSYLPSLDTISVIGGRGEGLNCSIPWYAKPLFPAFQLHNINSPVDRRFHQACVFHDLCYRHGLATYGYSQADCDTILREHAVRICRYLNKAIDACQLDAKKVLAGVAFFGAESYRNWDESTYFEFDPDPVRAERFTANRVVKHPFAASPSADDPRHWILSFDIKRTGVSIGCINCARRKFSQTELAEAEIEFDPNGEPSGRPSTEARPELTQAPLVSLPPRTGVSAPYLLNLPNGSQKLAWLNRQETHNTLLCLVVADPKKLLTHTRYQSAGCHKAASHRLSLTTADLFAATPLPVVDGVTGHVFVAGLSAQRARHVEKCSPTGASLRVYKTTDILGGLEWRDSLADCLIDKQQRSIGEFGFFQYPAIIKQNRHIFLSRTLVEQPAGGGRGGAGRPSGDLRVSVFDVGVGHASSKNIAIHENNLDISNAFDLMAPVTRDKDDYRVVSLTASTTRRPKRGEDNFRLSEIDLRDGSIGELDFTGAAAQNLTLHRSWIRRPVHVIESRASDGDLRTELVLSRSRMLRAEGYHGAVVFEFAVFGRRKNNAKAFGLQRSARCVVRYTGNLGGGHPACRRVDAVELGSRQGLQTRLQGTQLLVGDFSRPSDGPTPANAPADIALFDACASRQPMIFRANGASFDVVKDDGPALPRLLTCEGPLDSDYMAADIRSIPPLRKVKTQEP